MRKINKHNIGNLSEIVTKYKLQVRIDSIQNIINLNKLSVKFNLEIDTAEIYINESNASYIPMILSMLSADNVSVSLHFLFYFFYFLFMFYYVYFNLI